MKNINFKSVKIRNFLSVGEDPVTVTFRPGLHIITGVNRDKEDRRNGVGKSTIADAIYFAVFGDTLRDVKKEHIVNTTTKKGCSVELEVQIKNNHTVTDIKIIRTIEPSKCYIFINGEDKTLDSISSTNNFIRNAFSCTPEIFQNCVIMTINNTIPFMAKKKQEKREFIENVFNLSVFSQALSILKSDLSEKKKTYEVEFARCEENERSLQRLVKQQEEVTAERERKKETLIQRKQQNQYDIAQIQQAADSILIESVSLQHNHIKELEAGNTKIEHIISEARQTKAEHTVAIQHLTSQFKNIGTDKSICPVCLRDIDDHNKDHINNEKHKISLQIEVHKKQVDTLDKKILDITDKKSKIINKISELKDSVHKNNLKIQEKKNFDIRIKQLNEIAVTIEQDIKDIGSAVISFAANLDEQKNNLTRLHATVGELKNNINIIETSKFIFSEEGVKSVVIKKMLQLFNGKLAYYLKKMDANCTCTFNEYFEEEITDIKGKPCSYFNFSGAERKNIDLACLFTFMDMRRLQGDVCFNFSIYDELFDSSLDERGVDLVIDILNERVDMFNESIMVISHRKESIKAASGDIIFLEKKNNITRRVDFNHYTT